MVEQVAWLLSKFGASITVEHGKEATACRGFLRPVTGKYWQNMEHVFSDIGQVPRGQYLYIGPASVAVAQGDRIELEGIGYLVRRAERILIGDACVYCWGLCVQEGESDTWSGS